MSVFFLFALALAVGAASTLFWIPEDDLGRGYFQTNALVILGLLGLALAVERLNPIAPFGDRGTLGVLLLVIALASAFVYHGAIWKERWLLARGAAAGITIGGGIALILGAPGVVRVPMDLPGHRTLLALSIVTSALLLGWSVITMLLGHWYLVAPKLSFRHLTVFCWILLVIVVARITLVGVSLWTAQSIDPYLDPNPWRVLTSFAGQGPFLWFRLLWGLGIPLGLALMSLHCARNRSNQSATGILYVLVVGAMIGEITAYYLTATTGIPV